MLNNTQVIYLSIFLMSEFMSSLKAGSDHHLEIDTISEDKNSSLYSVFENIHTGIAIVDIEGKCLKVNSRLCEMLDYSEPELLETGFKKLIFPEEPEISPTFLDIISREHSGIYGKEICCLQKKRKTIWVNISTSTAIDHEKRPLYFVFQIEDMTRQKEVEFSLGNSEKKFELIFENAGDGMAINEPGGKFLKVNRITCEKLGYSREELLQKTATELVSSESADLFVEQARDLYRKGHAVVQIMAACKDGSTVPVELGMKLIEYEGKPALLSIVRDITERIKAEDETKIRNAAMDSALNPMVICSLEGCLTYTNPAFQKTWGYSA
ncbi:putative diguanylate cyclase DgcE [bioreactor metagenome]|uniref:Putative diguanylate cyclase DgcE n=1 Tax=bioreactor metagenome TaxID=1076179 RepID=A0A645CYB3_9ZZZZ